MKKQILNYFTDNNLLNDGQFGFIPKSNTGAACAHVLDYILVNIDRKKLVSCIFIDISKAFDCIDHSFLLKKLLYYGFSVKAHDLIKSYLENRKHFVQVGTERSQASDLQYGVIQGSVLGPLFFNIYINDIFTLNLKGKLQLYADDAVLLYTSINPAELQTCMQHDLCLINEWFCANFLAINTKKTHFMIFGQNANDLPNIDIKLNHESINRTYTTKYLGLTIDSKLDWKPHIESVRSKIVPIIYALKRVRNFIDEKTAWAIYNAYILPHLTYLSAIWAAAARSFLNPLIRLQNKCIKIIKKLHYLHPSIDLYSENVLSVKMLYLYDLILFIYKIKSNMLKCNLELRSVAEIHNYNTRQRNAYYVQYSRTNIAQKNIFRIGLKLFNRLPITLKNCLFVEFKKKLKSYVYINFDSLEINN